MTAKTAETPRCAAPGCPADAGRDDGGARLCREHQRRLRGRLAEAPGLLIDLTVTVSRQARMTEHSGKPAESPLPWDDRASLADSRLKASLLNAALAVQARAMIPVDDSLNQALAIGMDEAARWLIRQIQILVCLPEVGELWAEIDGCVYRARAATDRPQVRTRFLVGPCPQDQRDDDEHPGQPCPGEVWATIPDSEEDPAWLRCMTCDSRWDSTQWRRVGQRIRARMGPAQYPRRRG